MTSDIATSMGLAQPAGYLVNAISPASPVIPAGLHVGDVIVSVNGHSVDDAESFHYRIAILPIHSVADMGVLRKGQKLHVQVTLIAPPENPPRDKTTVTGHNPFAGATIQNISPAVIEEFNLHQGERGVVVTEVKTGTPAASIGLQPDDLLIGINNIKIVSVKDILQALEKKGSGWQIILQRKGNTISIMVGG